MNKIMYLGCLGSDPEPLVGGCKFSVAVKGFDGKQETVTWIKTMVFGVSATNCINVLTKGRRVLVEGRLDTSYKGESVVISNNIEFL